MMWPDIIFLLIIIAGFVWWIYTDYKYDRENRKIEKELNDGRKKMIELFKKFK